MIAEPAVRFDNPPVDQSIGRLLDDLRDLIRDLGKDGGLISPSVYDTAQVLRMHPPVEGVEPGLAWLLAQQQADGGWGDPAVATARDIPTLAAVLALHELGRGRRVQASVQAGLHFLESCSWSWRDVAMDAIPIAAELVLPSLLDEAHGAGLRLSGERYGWLIELRKQKLTALQGHHLVAGQAPTYSWEVLGVPVHPHLLDATGSVGHSPSATAAYLRAGKRAGVASHGARQAAERYLRLASRATGQNVPGVVPTVWPISSFERLYGLYALHLADLLSEPNLQRPVRSQQRCLLNWLQVNQGLDFGDGFAPDVDCTAVGICVLGPHPGIVTPDLVMQFKNEDHFYTYAGEMNPSVFSNAHAIHALAHLGLRQPATEQFLLRRQGADGRWLADKWHSSWRYTTLETVVPLAPFGHGPQIHKALHALVDDQNDDGGWGAQGVSNALETAYGVMMLHTLRDGEHWHEQSEARWRQATAWLLACADQPTAAPCLWMGKELYSPRRVDRAYVLSAQVLAARALSGDRAHRSTPRPSVLRRSASHLAGATHL